MDRELATMINADHLREAKLVHRIFVVFAILYLGFGLMDWVYVPNHLVLFLTLRVCYCIIPVANYFIVGRVATFRQTEWLALMNGAVAANVITFMIVTTEGAQSPYYAGLNLVGIIALSFFTFSTRFFWLTTAVIYAPYLIACTVLDHGHLDKSLILNASFIAGTILTSALIHRFKEYFRVETLRSRLDLANEIESRDRIIKTKTDESIQLNALSAQFSPQIVESIRSGKISLESGSARGLICTIFIDIVNSTQRVTKIDKSDVEQVLSRFLDDSMRILLKYDITIDKFLGDGILAFANAPAQRFDYVERVLRAALEIREKISQSQSFYRNHWGDELEIRIGVARGAANVGFFGTRRHFRSYTAIGPVVNLASRLCSAAQPSQILIDEQLSYEANRDFEIEFAGSKVLKGFDDGAIRVFEIKSLKDASGSVSEVIDCPNCKSVLSLETNELGQYVFLCRSCESTVTLPEIKRPAA